MEDESITFYIDEVTGFRAGKRNEPLRKLDGQGEHEELDTPGEIIVASFEDGSISEIRYESAEDEPHKRGIPWKQTIIIEFNKPHPDMISINGRAINLTEQQFRDILKNAHAGDSEAFDAWIELLAMIMFLGLMPLAKEVEAIYDDPLAKPVYDKLIGLLNSEHVTDRVNANLILDPNKPAVDFIREFKEKANLGMKQELAEDSKTFLSDKTQVGAVKHEKPKQKRGANLQTENGLRILRELRLDAIQNNRQIPKRKSAMDTANITDKTWRKHDPDLYAKWFDRTYR